MDVIDAYKNIFESLTEGLKRIYGDYLQSIILYGSVAKKTNTEESDIDIAVVVTKDDAEMHDEMVDMNVDLELQCGKVLSVLIIDLEEYTKWNSISPFYRNVKEEGIILWKAA